MKNQYAYQLLGQDDDWIYSDAKNRRATYSNLAAGDYTFRVKAGNADGYWNEQGKTLKITVEPPPWQTWWAYLIYVLIFASVVFTVFYVFAQQQIHRNLEAKVNERTRELVDTQQQLVQSEKMASLGTLTAGVAHEINNPNNFVHVSSQNLEVDLQKALQFFIDLAGDDADDDMLASFKQQFAPMDGHISTIKDGSDRIKTIVQDLRTFTQLDNAEQNTAVVTDLLTATVNLVRSQYIKIIDFELDFDDTPAIECYPAKLNQVFMNLIVNACYAIKVKVNSGESGNEHKGKINITCAVVDKAIQITIKDNGCGMNEETLTKLFEPFYTTKEVGEGTGLGLSISFGIVQLHQGAITAQSQLGVGSTFVVRLPIVS